MPIKLVDKKWRKKYIVKFEYEDLISNTKHKKSIKFGKKEQEDFIDNKNEEKR